MWTASVALLALVACSGDGDGGPGVVFVDAAADLSVVDPPDVGAGPEVVDVVGTPDLVVPVDAPVDVPVDLGAWPVACTGDRDCPATFPGQLPCQRALCDLSQGLCVATEAPDGTICEDVDLCIVDSVCLRGSCVGRPRLCDDGEFCTADRCESDRGCVHVPRAAACDDGDPCTQGDACQAGACVPGASVCPCETDDDCLSHDDGDLCTGTFVCASGGCRIDPETVVHCPLPEPGACAWSRCDSSTGACETVTLADGYPCEDWDACTVDDVCLSGVCTPGPELVCDDGNPCTDDSCDPVVGCLAPAAARPCSDGDGCTEGDRCEDGVCLPGSTNDCLEETCHAARLLSCGEEDRWGRNNADATDFVLDYDCGDEALLGLDGPELAYAIVAPYDGLALLSALDLPDTATLVLLEGARRGCDPSACRDFDDESIFFSLSEGSTYYALVDAPSGVDPGFALRLDCSPDREQDCGDGLDEDNDGATDCADLDCAEDGDCEPPELDAIYTLGCGVRSRIAGHTTGAGSTDERSVYGCGVGNEVLSGPELTFVLRAPVSGTYELRLDNVTAPLELVALLPESRGGGCLTRGPGPLQIPITAGEEILVVVDGADEAGAFFTLSVGCPEGTERFCGDGADDDGDGATDCDDEDCALVSPCDIEGCPGSSETLSCGERVSSTTASALATPGRLDYPCSLFPFSGPELLFPVDAPTGSTVVARLTHADEDLDVFLLSVPEGAGCDADYCVSQGQSAAQFRVREGEQLYALVDGYDGTAGGFQLAVDCVSDTESNCTDGEDEDGDGDIDCADSDCFDDAACPSCLPTHAAVLGCDEPYRISTLAPAATDLVDRYGCSENDYSGPERVFAFDTVYSGRVTFWLEERNADLDVILLEAVDGDCRPSRCLGYSPYRVRAMLSGGQRYFIVIDGYMGDAGEATLTLECEDW